MFFNVEPRYLNRLDLALQGASERHESANQKFADINTAITNFSYSSPCEILSEKRYGMDDHHLVVTKVLPQSVMITVGELVHALRSVLDNLVFAYWIEDAADTAGEKDIKYVDFPVAEKESDFNRAIKKLRLKPDITSMLKSLQCHELGVGSDIYRLSQLDNIDKHRLIPIAECQYAVSGIKEMVRNFSTNDFDAIDVPEVQLTVSSMTNGPSIPTKFGYVYSSRPIIARKSADDYIDTSKNQTEVSVYIGEPFPNYVNLLDTLYAWIWRVHAILELAKNIAVERVAAQMGELPS